MKPTNTWSFSTTLQNIDVNRILREVEEAGANVALITIDGKVYTAFRANHPKANSVTSVVHVHPTSKVCRHRDVPGDFALRAPRPVGPSEIMFTGRDVPSRWLVKAGDHLGILLDRVVTRVETFQ